MADSSMPRAQAHQEANLKKQIVRLEMHPPHRRDLNPPDGSAPWDAYVQVIPMPTCKDRLAMLDPFITQLLGEKDIEVGPGSTGTNGLRQYPVRYTKRSIDATNDIRAINEDFRSISLKL